jgi:hypothetical protein
LENYQANIRVLRNLPQAYHFKVFFFWQPSLASGNKPLTPFEQQVQTDLQGSSQFNSFTILKAVNDEAARRSLQGGDFIFLGRIFDAVPEYRPSHASRPEEAKSWRMQSPNRWKTRRTNSTKRNTPFSPPGNLLF